MNYGTYAPHLPHSWLVFGGAMSNCERRDDVRKPGPALGPGSLRENENERRSWTTPRTNST